MLPDRVSNPGPLTYESGALPIALRGPRSLVVGEFKKIYKNVRIADSHSRKKNEPAIAAMHGPHSLVRLGD